MIDVEKPKYVLGEIVEAQYLSDTWNTYTVVYANLPEHDGL